MCKSGERGVVGILCTCFEGRVATQYSACFNLVLHPVLFLASHPSFFCSLLPLIFPSSLSSSPLFFINCWLSPKCKLICGQIIVMLGESRRKMFGSFSHLKPLLSLLWFNFISRIWIDHDFFFPPKFQCLACETWQAINFISIRF